MNGSMKMLPSQCWEKCSGRFGTFCVWGFHHFKKVEPVVSYSDVSWGQNMEPRSVRISLIDQIYEDFMSGSVLPIGVVPNSISWFQCLAVKEPDVFYTSNRSSPPCILVQGWILQKTVETATTQGPGLTFLRVRLFYCVCVFFFHDTFAYLYPKSEGARNRRSGTPSRRFPLSQCQTRPLVCTLVLPCGGKTWADSRKVIGHQVFKSIAWKWVEFFCWFILRERNRTNKKVHVNPIWCWYSYVSVDSSWTPSLPRKRAEFWPPVNLQALERRWPKRSQLPSPMVVNRHGATKSSWSWEVWKRMKQVWYNFCILLLKILSCCWFWNQELPQQKAKQKLSQRGSCFKRVSAHAAALPSSIELGPTCRLAAKKWCTGDSPSMLKCWSVWVVDVRNPSSEGWYSMGIVAACYCRNFQLFKYDSWYIVDITTLTR